MKNIKSTLILLFCLISSLTYAGGPPTLIQSITSLNTPIVAGEEVYFQSTVQRLNMCNSSFGLLVDFGPFADTPPLNLGVGMSSANFNMTLGPIVFNMPFSGIINQSIFNASCNTNTDVASLAIDVLPAAIIPTLSQWGLIIIGFFLMIFGIVSLKNQAIFNKKAS
jgi:hypothetical protein